MPLGSLRTGGEGRGGRHQPYCALHLSVGRLECRRHARSHAKSPVRPASRVDWLEKGGRLLYLARVSIG